MQQLPAKIQESLVETEPEIAVRLVPMGNHLHVKHMAEEVFRIVLNKQRMELLDEEQIV
jgi:hypothetical protein